MANHIYPPGWPFDDFDEAPPPDWNQEVHRQGLDLIDEFFDNDKYNDEGDTMDESGTLDVVAKSGTEDVEMAELSRQQYAKRATHDQQSGHHGAAQSTSLSASTNESPASNLQPVAETQVAPQTAFAPQTVTAPQSQSEAMQFSTQIGLPSQPISPSIPPVSPTPVAVRTQSIDNALIGTSKNVRHDHDTPVAEHDDSTLQMETELSRYLQGLADVTNTTPPLSQHDEAQASSPTEQAIEDLATPVSMNSSPEPNVAKQSKRGRTSDDIYVRQTRSRTELSNRTARPVREADRPDYSVDGMFREMLRPKAHTIEAEGVAKVQPQDDNAGKLPKDETSEALQGQDVKMEEVNNDEVIDNTVPQQQSLAPRRKLDLLWIKGDPTDPFFQDLPDHGEGPRKTRGQLSAEKAEQLIQEKTAKKTVAKTAKKIMKKNGKKGKRG